MADPSTVEPSVDTTWVDGAGVAHDAWIQVRPGVDEGILEQWWDYGSIAKRSYYFRLEF